MRHGLTGLAAFALAACLSGAAFAANAVTAPIKPVGTVIVFPMVRADQNGSIGVYAVRGGAEVKLGEAPFTIGGGSLKDERIPNEENDFAVTLSDKVAPGERILVKFMNMEGQVVDTQELAVPQ